VENTLFRHFSG